MTDPYREGFNARGREESTDANPYRKLSEKWFSWADGWKDRDEHERDKGDALDSIGWNG
jgi:hypothetical protein